VEVRVVTDVAELEAIRPAWEELLARSASSDPTLTPIWLLAWWRVFGPEGGRALRAALFHDGARLAGLAPLLARPHRHRSGIPCRRLELLATGEAEADEIGSDYVGVIAERGAEGDVAAALAGALAGGALGPWDELAMPAMRGDAALPVLLAEALRGRGLDATVEVTSVSPHIPLPATWDGYLAALPSSRRYLVRRSIRDLEAWAGGALRLERATTRDELARGLAILTRLHAERWSAEDQAGVFASPRFRAFHEEVMPALLDRGALDLRWIEARGEPIAAIYNVVWQGKVQFYQGGRRMDLPKGLRPGTVIQALAIRAAIEEGRREYDFLAGTSRYKMELALAARPLVELRATRPSLGAAARRAAELAIAQAQALRRTLWSNHRPGA
jgi:CelD/BcsL family acetyltransferase involved in cellulose biosynthesis